VASANPFCLDALTNRDACLLNANCDALRERRNSMASGVTDGYACAHEEQLGYLYCSGMPDARSCGQTCALRAQCRDIENETVERCALECLQNQWSNRVERGANCWNAQVLLSICVAASTNCERLRLAMDQPGDPADHPCRNELVAMRDQCQ
jgi:hypothetical protein